MGTNQTVINEADLRELSPAERRQLARSLAVIDYPDPLLEMTLARGRKLGALFSIVACTVLALWIIVLVFTLHRSFHAHYWRLAWVGFDVVLLSGFAATGWAFWRGRQIVIACLLVTGSLLCCDAWFDVMLDLGTSGQWQSVASALVVELPIAFLMFAAARRLIRLSALVAVSESGEQDQVPSLWRMPLVGGGARPRSNHGSVREKNHQGADVDPHARVDLTYAHGYRLHRGNRG
jgi:hypothetical protein